VTSGCVAERIECQEIGVTENDNQVRMGPPQPRHAGHCATLDGSNRGHFSGPGSAAAVRVLIRRAAEGLRATR
jgi:hypothetical protein